MQNGEFLINELAREAGVTPRTIRYYTVEGLLPAPITRGKYAYYTPEHLNRLRLVLRMKETYLPLREIKQAINALTDREVAIQLQSPPAVSPGPSPYQPSTGAGAQALDYIERLMDSQAELRATYLSSPAPAPAAEKAATPSPMAKSAPVPAAAQAPLSSAAETWRRIPLADGVELHLREPVTTRDAGAIDQLLAFASHLFTSYPKEP